MTRALAEAISRSPTEASPAGKTCAKSVSAEIRSFEFGRLPQAVLDRLGRLSQALELDRDRTRRWAIAEAYRPRRAGGGRRCAALARIGAARR